MLLKELNLIGFGKFNNRKIELKDGINLIYGENEAGKSTIHSFIDGMFYGFLRPNARTALYIEEHEKYNPWDNTRYAGVIRFRYKDKDYRIERDFSRGRESTRVIDENTGVDITKEIDVGSNRILQPGIHFFGFNTRIFSNTISIKQLGTKTDDKLANEVTEKLINVSTSLDDNISIDKAIVELKNAMSDIGTDRAPTRPYALKLKQIESLENERKSILSEREEYDGYLEEEDRLKELLISEEDKLSRRRNNLQKFEFYKKAKTLEEAQILTHEIKRLEGIRVNLSPYSKLSMDEYKEAISLSKALEFLGGSIEDNTKEFEDTEKRLESLMREGENASGSTNSDSGEHNLKLSKYNKIRLLSIILIIITLGIGIMSFISNKNILALILFPVFGIIGVYYTSKIEALKKEHMEKLRIITYNRESHMNTINEIKLKKSSLIDKINNLTRDKEENLGKLENIFEKSNVTNLEEFNLGLEKKYKYENNLREEENKGELLRKVLGEDTLESLRDEINHSKITLNKEIINLDENQLRYEIDRLNQNITDNKIALRGVEENLRRLEKNISRLVDIEEDILRNTALKEELELKYKSLQLAADTIEELSKDIHSQFAPAINRRVGKVIRKITNGKYTNIKISESLDINVENPSTGELIHLNSLSGGTIDQLYFALRFGIINSMVEENLPLILDDCFIQYDDNRLINIIEFLRDISQHRQIVLFTCHNREERILDELKLEYNLVNLT